MDGLSCQPNDAGRDVKGRGRQRLDETHMPPVPPWGMGQVGLHARPTQREGQALEKAMFGVTRSSSLRATT